MFDILLERGIKSLRVIENYMPQLASLLGWWLVDVRVVNAAVPSLHG